MRPLAWGVSFRLAFKRRTRRAPDLQDRILEVLALMAADPFDPKLRTHRLRGQLEGLWVCGVEYDCRVVFAFEPDPIGGEDVIVLADIGTHDEVY